MFAMLFLDWKCKNLQKSAHAVLRHYKIGQGQEEKYNFVIIRWQISTSIKVFCASFHSLKFMTFKKLVTVTEYNFHDAIPRWQISKSTKVVRYIYALALTISEILTFQICYHQMYIKVMAYKFLNDCIFRFLIFGCFIIIIIIINIIINIIVIIIIITKMFRAQIPQ